MMPAYTESAEYFYDPVAAERPILFARKYLRHWEGRSFAGRPFEFLPWQQAIVRTIFGWKRRSDGRRRFSELYLLTAKGAGKTPFFSALGTYMLLMDGEAGPHVISGATDVPQAHLTLDTAKRYVEANRDLARHCTVQQYRILADGCDGKWTAVSGTGEGKHGFRPSCLLLDEAHEWPSGKLYHSLTTNLPKREQPLCLVATNAGESRASFAYTLHQRAERAMEKPDADPALLPVIYEADESLAWDTEAAAAAANPSLGTAAGCIYPFSQLAPELAKARAGDEAQARYERLFLSRWPEGAAGRWLNMLDWEECSAAFTAADVAASTLYIGADMSLGDDLCAVAHIFATPDRFYASVRFWMPRETAERYESENGIPYSEWADAGEIEIVPERTVDSAVRRRIAAHVFDMSTRFPVKVVAYDPARADEMIAHVEQAGIKAVPTPQNWKLSPGLEEIERRLKARTLVVSPNRVLRFNAESAEVRQDAKGNLHLQKPNARGRYAGTRAKKVDGIAALANAMYEAHRHVFPSARKFWKGKAELCSRTA